MRASNAHTTLLEQFVPVCSRALRRMDRRTCFVYREQLAKLYNIFTEVTLLLRGSNPAYSDKLTLLPINKLLSLPISPRSFYFEPVLT